MNSAIIVFPGSNCDRDARDSLVRVTGAAPAMVWHQEHDLPAGLDLAVLPGGFSYGDYLRSGAMAARSPIMEAVRAHAARGGYVLGICNGFQILTEAGLLPGALTRNSGLAYVCRDVALKIEAPNTAFTSAYGDQLATAMPVAHNDGRYYADEDTLDQLEDEGRIAFRYLDNPNGSLRDIAGVLGADKRVLGLMPHPDRCSDPELGRAGGIGLWRSLLDATG